MHVLWRKGKLLSTHGSVDLDVGSRDEAVEWRLEKFSMLHQNKLNLSLEQRRSSVTV
jgi:hypothetical protein